MVVRIRRVPIGDRQGYLISPLAVEQHQVAASNPAEVARAVLSCFTEVEAATYARWKGMRPDIAALPTGDSFDDPLNRGGKPIASAAPPGDKRGGNAWASGGARERDPADYSPNADGTWTSPSGRRVKDQEACRRIVRRRVAAGLPIVPEGSVFDLSALADVIVAAAVREGLAPHEWVAAAVGKAEQPVVVEPALPEVVDLAARRRQRDARRQVDQVLAAGQLELDLGLGVAA